MPEPKVLLAGLIMVAISAGVDALFAETKRRATNFVKHFYAYIIAGIVVVVVWSSFSPSTQAAIKAYAVAVPISLVFAVLCGYVMFRTWDSDFTFFPVRVDNENAR